jgi:hypothetical protein
MNIPALSVVQRTRWGLLASALLVAVPAVNSPLHADDGKALEILKSMSDYLAAQQSFSATFESGIEVVTSDLEKVQFNSSGAISLERPDKLRARRTGGYTHVDFVFDGKQAIVHLLDEKSYARLDVDGTIDNLVDELLADGLTLPGTDLIVSNTFAVLSEGVIEAKHVGVGVIDDMECEHLAFRNRDTDWQIWVRVGDEPIPCKYVITSKHVTGAPQYTLLVRDWTAGSGGVFDFTPGADEKEVQLQDLPKFDEVPEEAGVND